MIRKLYANQLKQKRNWIFNFCDGYERLKAKKEW